MSLTTNFIANKLRNDIHANRYFGGVFPFNVLPRIICYPVAIVINTHPSNKEGEHWLAMYFDKTRFCEFFDSFGFGPDYYDLDGYVKTFSTNYAFNKTQLQSLDSDTCGYYCLNFILLKCRGFSLQEIISSFDKNDFKKNDTLIRNIIN